MGQPGNHRRPWTAEQVGELRRLAKEKMLPSEVAVKLGRTDEAIQTKADVEGIRLAQRHKRPDSAGTRVKQRSAHSLELDRRRLIKMLDELRSGKLGQVPEAEAEQLITAIEQRLDSLSKELGEFRRPTQ